MQCSTARVKEKVQPKVEEKTQPETAASVWEVREYTMAATKLR